jgi:hypothetical protein
VSERNKLARMTNVTPGKIVYFANYATVYFSSPYPVRYLRCQRIMLLSGYPSASGAANFIENIFFLCYKKLWTKREGGLSSDYSEIWWNWIYCQMSPDALPRGPQLDIILYTAPRIPETRYAFKLSSYRICIHFTCCIELNEYIFSVTGCLDVLLSSTRCRVYSYHVACSIYKCYYGS